MGLFHRGKKNNDDEPDSVQTNSFSDIMNGGFSVCSITSSFLYWRYELNGALPTLRKQ